MNRKKPSDKSETLRQLAQGVLTLEITKGHLGWKVTDLVRKCKTSRALIYRYLGNSKTEMLERSFTLFVNDFYSLNQSSKERLSWRHIHHARERLIQHPEVIQFYIKWRSSEAKLREEFVETEKKFQKKLKKSFPAQSELQILATHTILHGLVTAPFLTPDQAAEIYQLIFEKVK